MIEIFEGRLGGGKTYSAVERAADKWRLGGTVATNIAIKWDNVCAFGRERFGVDFLREQFMELENEHILDVFSHIPAGTRECPTLVIIDEAHINLGVLEHARAGLKKLFDALSQSRKLDIDFIFITQNAKNIDSRIARLIQFVWRFRDLEKWNIPLLGSYPSLIRFLTFGLKDGKQILQVCLDYDGKTVNHRRFRQKDPAIFELYDTNALLSPIPLLEGKKSKHELAKVESKRRPMLKWILVGMIALVLFGLYRTWNWYSGHKAESSPVAAADVPAGSKAAARVQPQSAASPPASSSPAAYEIREEVWLSQGNGWMRTEATMYRVNTICAYGLVQAIRDDTVRVLTPTGGTLYIVGKENRKPPVPMPLPTPWNKEIVVAPAPTIVPLDGSSSWKDK